MSPRRALLLLAGLLVPACSGPPAGPPSGAPTQPGREARVEEVSTWPPTGGRAVRFAWPPMTLVRQEVVEELGADGAIQRDEGVPSRLVVTAHPDGGVAIALHEDRPPAGGDALDRALSREYHRLHIVTRPDGQIVRTDGIDEFIAAVRADAEAAGRTAMLARPDLRAIIEASVDESYVIWIVTWLDAGWVPEPGRTVRHTIGSGADAVVLTMSSEDLSADAPGRVRLRARVEGRARRISTHRTFLSDLVPGELFEQARGFYQIELDTDPSTLIPVRAVVEKELRAGTTRGWKRTTTTFVRA